MPTLFRRGPGHHAKKDPDAHRQPMGRKRLRRPGESHIRRLMDERRAGRGPRARRKAT